MKDKHLDEKYTRQKSIYRIAGIIFFVLLIISIAVVFVLLT